MASDLVLGLGLGVTAILAALGALLVMAGTQTAASRRRPSIFDEAETGTLFLFDGEDLMDCTPGGRAILAASPAGSSSWSRLMAHLSRPFAGVERHLADLPRAGTITLEGEDGEGNPMLLKAELRGGVTRITISDVKSAGAQIAGDPLAHRAMSEELATLRAMMMQAPIMAWQERADGSVIWANTLYVLTAAEFQGVDHELSWPLPRLFDRIASSQGAAGQRQKLTRRDGSVAWFDLAVVPDGQDRRIYALPCDSAVTAETNLRDLMQTLTKTFAHLTVGLAIFDSQKQLQLFNPALLDLTGLPPDFLSSRPTVLAMLDAMRDRNMVPEPRDYRQWRKHLGDMNSASPAGVYSEVWSLAGGQTYRVVGRPHTNGSLALMFEDISSEVSRTRRFRADLELGQSVIDSMTESVAVFSQTGQLVMTNRAYGELWGNDLSDRPVDVAITSATRIWAALCAPSPIWAEVEDYVAMVGDRDGWETQARLLDGRLLRCRLHPLEGGATLIGFSPEVIHQSAAEPLAKIGRKRA